MISTPLWLCEDCGGPAVWTVLRGLVHYHCESECDGFMQMELFAESGVPRYEEGRSGVERMSPQEENELEELPF